ncbi:glutathione S-transferase family protein [Cupriavidus laharis]|uniref:glutathione S-transferase family protein n=1 Tax=Cupriavidus laharis TaxID=151654 RepID=UPI001CC43FA6|nr:glutathione S-transferase C-terminal domain-containing protein [Cupriavidus laharis]
MAKGSGQFVVHATSADVVDAIEKALAPGPFVLGPTFSAADVYLGASLAWAGKFGAPRLGESPRIQDYVKRVTARDAFKRAAAE